MLIIQAKVGEEVEIGDNVTLIILPPGNKADKYFPTNIRLGFVAPKEIKILRANAKVKEPKTEEYDNE